MITDLNERLAALEPLRKNVGPIAKAIMLAKLWFVRMGAALVASVALPFAVVSFASSGDTMPTAAVALAVGAMFVPLGLGLASVLPTTFRVFSASGTDADAAYRIRFRSDVLEPLLRAAVPAAAVDFDSGIDRALFDRSGVYTTQGSRFEGRLRVSGQVDGATWTAGPVRETEDTVNSSSTGGSADRKTIVVHDGLFAWTSVNGRAGAVLVADRQTGERAHSRAHALKTLIGRRPEPLSTGDTAFDGQFMVLSEAPESLALVTPDIRRALLDAKTMVGEPVRIAIGPEGVGMAFPDRGRFTGVAASADIEQTIGFTSGEALLADAGAALAADGMLLKAIPQALMRLRDAVSTTR